MVYLKAGALPEDKPTAQKLIIDSAQYTLLDGVLYHVGKDKTLRVVPPSGDQEKLFHKAHGGKFGGQLNHHYWWPGMRKDIRQWCQACIPCATRNVERQIRPLLTPIPVGEPFDKSLSRCDPVSRILISIICISLSQLFDEMAQGVPHS